MINDVLHSQLKSKRETMGLPSAKLAHLLNITIAAYDDLEMSPAEWRMVLPFYKLRFLISLLEIDMARIIGPAPASKSFDGGTDISILIKALRNEKKLSKHDFAEHVGFQAVFTDIVEEHPLGLELYPPEVAMLVARKLEISPNEFVWWMIRR